MQKIIVNNSFFSQNIAGQVLGMGAFSEFQNQSSIRNSRLTKQLIDKPYLSDHLAMIEQRVGSALSLSWLNMNDTRLDKRLYRTKRDDQYSLIKKRAIKDCVLAIRNGDLKQAAENWENIHKEYSDLIAFKRVIKYAYAGNLCNFDKVDSFIQAIFNSISSKLRAYQMLMAEMRKNNQVFTSETLRLAYRFDQIMNYPGYSLLSPELKSLFELEKSNFPQAVKYLLYNNVCLRSMAQNNEYLYASWFQMPNNMGKHIFTWIPNEYAGAQAVWRFESLDNGITFYLYNPKQEVYLHSIDEKYGDDRRNIVVQSSRELLGKWRIQLAATESEIILKNDFYGEVLYASDIKYNDNRRYVFTWPKGPVPSARWKVEDCGSSTRQRRDTPDDGLESTDLTLNTKQMFFQIKEQANQINKTSDLNRETIVKSMPSWLNKTVS